MQSASSVFFCNFVKFDTALETQAREIIVLNPAMGLIEMSEVIQASTSSSLPTRAASAAAIKSSRSPSNTAPVLEVSTFVRKSLTI